MTILASELGKLYERLSWLLKLLVLRRLRNYGDDTDKFADLVLNGTWVRD